ncbi:hypothetical protein D3C78_1948580 [compost metagenome]
MVKVLDSTTNSVVSGCTFFSVSFSCAPSTLETKCMFMRGWPNGFSALQTISEPRSEPPMPMLTMSVIGWWV